MSPVLTHFSGKSQRLCSCEAMFMWGYVHVSKKLISVWVRLFSFSYSDYSSFLVDAATTDILHLLTTMNLHFSRLYNAVQLDCMILTLLELSEHCFDIVSIRASFYCIAVFFSTLLCLNLFVSVEQLFLTYCSLKCWTAHFLTQIKTHATHRLFVSHFRLSWM